MFFCEFFLDNLFPSPLTWFQRAIVAILVRRCDFLQKYGEVDRIIKNFYFERDNEKHYIFHLDENNILQMDVNKYNLIMMPRGFAKTTVGGIAIPVFFTVFHCADVFVYVSNAGPHSEMQLANVKAELTSNNKIVAFFGDLRPKRSADERWASTQFETTSGITMIARGSQGQVRGLNHNGKRPKYVIGDDLEDKESVVSDLQRQKMRTWMYGDLMPVLPSMDKEASITILGTLLHPDSLLTTLANDPQWTVVKLAAVDIDGEPIWPEQMDLNKLDLVKESFVRAGELTTFYQEYFNKSVSSDQQKFKLEHFVYASPEKPTLNAIFCDPAISKSITADFTVITVVGMEPGGKIYLLESWAKRGASPRETIDRYFELHLKWNCRKAGIETVAYQAALVHLIKEEMFRKKHYFEITPVAHLKKKEERIEGILQPRFANGYICFTRRFVSLETQLLDWPHAKHDDEADALAGAIALLDPFAAQAIGDTDLTKDMYRPLSEVFNRSSRVRKQNVGSP